jgi:hypothetical protein
MASLRKKFRLSWADGAPVEVTTSARDVVNASTYSGVTEDPAAATFGLLYAALVRLGFKPPPYEDWLDAVDEVEQVGTVVTDLADPTQPVPSVGGPSPSPASPAPTIAAGSTGTMNDLSSLLS